MLALLLLFLSQATCWVVASLLSDDRLQQPLLKTVLPGAAGSWSTAADLTRWLDLECDVAIERLLANVAPGGSNVKDAVPGTVIASPSTQDPDYYYQWIRDAAITMSTLVRINAESPERSLATRIQPLLSAYASLQGPLQRTANPSGVFEDLSSLGEPKFLANADAFTGSWGRPQRDGPALRAVTLMHYLRWYNTSHPLLWSSTTPAGTAPWFRSLYKASMPAESVVKADLEYVSRSWELPGFDLWEEVEGLHFFTAMVQMRALREGSALAAAFGDAGASAWYEMQHQRMRGFVLRFWHPQRQSIVASLDSARCGLDCSVLLASLRATDESAAGLDSIFAPWSDEILSSLLSFLRDQATRYPLNHQRLFQEGSPIDSVLAGIAVGRYPEDVYDGTGSGGGHPWFLCTASVSQLLYRARAHFIDEARIPISPLGRPFWQALAPNRTLLTGNLTADDEAFDELLDRLRLAGDGFLMVVRRHATRHGALSEQFDAVTGFERGARDLTWSYGAFLDAKAWRDRSR